MPYVNVKLLEENVTDEAKAEVIAGITNVLVEALGKKSSSVFVVIDEVALSNWGVGGESVTARRQHAAALARAEEFLNLNDQE